MRQPTSISIRKTLTLTLLATLLALLFININIRLAHSQPLLYVDPPTIVDDSLTPGSSFSININVSNVLDLYGYEFKLSYQTSVLTATSITLGSFFPSNAIEWMKSIDDAAGVAWYSVTMPFGAPTGVDGNGTLAIIEFTVDALGISNLQLYDDMMGNSAGIPIPYQLGHGYFANAPFASFTYSPSEPVPNEVITFNASASRSMDPSGHITTYEWDLGDGTTKIYVEGVNLTDITTHSYSETGDYYVNLTVTDSDGLQDWETNLVSVISPGVYVSPSSGPVGTKVTVKGYGFHPTEWGELYFDDHFLTYNIKSDATGRFNATFNVPLSEPGPHEVRAYFYYVGTYNYTTFTVIDTTPLEVKMDVGAIHFRGEIAEFYTQTIYKGTPVNATTIKATLYKPDGSHETLPQPSKVSTGLYKSTYTIPADAETGSYVLTVEASYSQLTVNSKGASLKSFLLSDTLTGWNAWLVAIKDDIATIITDTGTIKADVKAINATLVSIEGRVATIETDIGTIKTDIGTINAKITSIEGNTVTITSDLGTIKQEIGPAGFQFGVATLAFSLVAAIGAILSVVLLRKKKTAG